MKIIADAGHGGDDPGAIGPTGLKEKDVTIKICNNLMLMLSSPEVGHSVLLTRCGDEFVSLQNRCNIANSERADLFLSIHCNSFINPNVKGFEVWTSVGLTYADKYATSIYRKIHERFPLMRGRMDMTDNDVDKEMNFKVLRGTSMPAVLIEIGFISNPEEENSMMDQDWLYRMSSAISHGVIAAG